MVKAAFNKENNLFTSKVDLNLRKKPIKCYSWGIALCGPETWTLGRVDQKYLKSFKIWYWRRLEKIIWTHHVRNEDVLLKVKQDGISYVQ